MIPYPSINWWTGNLRPYESLVSFVTRFCTLNGITLSKYENYFNYKVGEEWRLTGADIDKIATLLNEDLAVVQSVFAPSITLEHCVHYNLPAAKARSDSVRYCEKCAEIGFHCYLHEMEWLSKCPFHITELKTFQPVNQSGVFNIRHMATMKDLMCLKCESWPRAKDGDFNIDRQELFDRIVYWVKNAQNAATRFSQGQLWFSGQNEFGGTSSLRHAMGQLRTLEVMPIAIESLFTALGEPWQVEILRFPLQIKTEFLRLTKDVGFTLLLDFYKKTSACSSTPPSFVMKLRAAQDSIKAKHGKCHCTWARMNAGWHSHWVRADPDGWPYWDCICPYNIAIEELELGWGRSDLALTRRKLEDERLRYIKLSRLMYDAGLIGYTPEAHISPDGYLYAYPQVWPCCEWMNDSTLTQLLNAICEFEIESALIGLNIWLDIIKEGASPDVRDDPTRCIRLCETQDGLSLIKWTPVKQQEGDAKPSCYREETYSD